jgi:L-asparaginase
VLAPAKPVVLTAAMRPATSLQADGPQNLLDAVTLAGWRGVQGVVAVLNGRVHGPAEVHKVLPFSIDAFTSGEAGPVALIHEQEFRQLRPWPTGQALGVDVLGADAATWPWVGIVVSHAGADGAVVDALVAAGVRGLVVQGTGNGTVHASVQQALERAQQAGVAVLRTTRCAGGAIVGSPAGALPLAAGLSPAKARVELMLRLLGAS